MTLVDDADRRHALTALGETLLVEAAAGTGKTALMAGRCALLLASGVAPRAIAAITFTELAAGELALRIRRMVDDLVAGQLPRELASALPQGLSPAQHTHLVHAAARLDDLTATTIHGFCQTIIRAYAVEADVDPGAGVVDRPQADALFDGAFTEWLRRRLSGDNASAGAVGVLAADQPLQIVGTLRELAKLRRERRTARPPPVDLSSRPDLEFRDAVDSFERWLASTPGEPKTADMLAGMRELADFFGNTLATACDFARLWRLATPPRPRILLSKGLEWRNYSSKEAWRRVAGDAGNELFGTAEAHYETCRSTFASLMGQIGGALVADLSGELDELLEDYASRKRAAAALDFDDLLLKARDLIRGHEEVREALGRRYRHIFVDEFQDTDSVQAEVIFTLAAGERGDRWIEARPRPGSLFLVGDPKQAIYRFRGAHVAVYAAVREMFARRDPASIIRVTTNFRSAPEILEHVNSCFEAPFQAVGQPGYVALAPTLERRDGGPPRAARITIDVADMKAGQQRDAEAEAVADLCRRLIGAIDVRRADGTRTPLRPGDIALLAPGGTELWRYERELERQHLGVASQAGKALMRRQETQDVLALLRTLADPFDTLAFGAFLRGPMVGLTESRLLAIAGALPPSEDGGAVEFNLQTDARLISDPEARSVVESLQALRRRAAVTTPSILIAEAIERLQLRVALALRTGDRAGRAIANLDALVSLATPYRVRGLSAFVAELTADWASGASVTEGRIDESETAVSLVTIHSAKGLEWPVVIPINTSTQLRAPDQFVHRQADDTLHWVLGGLTPPHLAAAQAEEAVGGARERERLWYVAMTRARDLLILPQLEGAALSSWARVLDLGTARLPEIDLGALATPTPERPEPVPNTQTAEVFAEEAAAVLASAPPITWRRPSDHDLDRPEVVETTPVDESADILEAPSAVGAGRVRGVLLHKLMEEMLTGELEGIEASVIGRAGELAAELMAMYAGGPQPDAAECAATALRARRLPEIAALWDRLEAESPIYAADADGTLIAGRADAIAITEGRVDVVVDWKSDLEPSARTRADHMGQLSDYLRILGASRGAIVYLSRDEVVWTT